MSGWKRVCGSGNQQVYRRIDITRPDAGDPGLQYDVTADSVKYKAYGQGKADVSEFGYQQQDDRQYNPDHSGIAQFCNQRHQDISNVASQMVLDEVQNRKFKGNQFNTSSLAPGSRLLL